VAVGEDGLLGRLAAQHGRERGDRPQVGHPGRDVRPLPRVLALGEQPAELVERRRSRDDPVRVVVDERDSAQDFSEIPNPSASMSSLRSSIRWIPSRTTALSSPTTTRMVIAGDANPALPSAGSAARPRPRTGRTRPTGVHLPQVGPARTPAAMEHAIAPGEAGAAYPASGAPRPRSRREDRSRPRADPTRRSSPRWSRCS
jgi:hypothetical protein